MATEAKKAYGPVQNGVIQHLAVTGVAQFNPDEEGCPSRWYYKNVEQRPEPSKTWHTTGTDVDDQVNHYLSNNQNVLGKIARAGIHLLPEPGADLLVQWGLNNKMRPKDPASGKWKNFFPPQESRLWAAGVPFIGFPDVINARQQYLVPSDDTIHQTVELVTEPGVVEVLDNKTTSDLKWAKPSNALLHTTQMNGYGLFIVEIEPAVVGVRLSHNTYRTDSRMAPAAIKRSVLVTAKEIRERWTRVVEPIVEQMKSVAGMKRDVDVPYNLGACDSFGGCPHREYCHARSKLNPITRMKMSLLKNRPGAPAPAAPVVAAPNGAMPWIGQPPQPPMPPAPPVAAPVVQQAAPQMMAPPPPPPQYAAPQPQPQYAAPQVMAPPPAPTQAPVQSVQGPAPILAGAAIQNSRYWVNGQEAQYLCSTNGKQAFMPIVNGQMAGAPVHVDYNVQIFPADGVSAPAASVAPTAPAAPVVSQQAAPPPPPPADQQAAPPKKRGRRPNMQVQDVTAPTANPVISIAQVAAQAAAAPMAIQTPAQGLSLFVNAMPNGPFEDLSAYVHEAVESIRAQFNVPDIRVAPDDSPIAFAKWRGVLAGCVRAEPPEPGVYVAFTKDSEFTQVVVEALAPLCAQGQFVRGIA